MKGGTHRAHSENLKNHGYKEKSLTQQLDKVCNVEKIPTSAAHLRKIPSGDPDWLLHTEMTLAFTRLKFLHDETGMPSHIWETQPDDLSLVGVFELL